MALRNPINREVVRLAVPRILANITVPLVGLVDTAVSGHLGDASLIGGIAIALSAAFQGRAAAGACDALVEGGSGFVNYLIALGVIETIAIFVLVFAILLLGKIPTASATAAVEQIVSSVTMLC